MLAGVPEQNISFVCGKVAYQSGNQASGGDHAVCLVRGENGSTYMLDNNIQNPVYMTGNADGLVGAGHISSEAPSLQGREVNISFSPTLAIPLGSKPGSAYIYPQNSPEMEQVMNPPRETQLAPQNPFVISSPSPQP